MEIKEIESIIEAILFASGDPVSIDRLSSVLEVEKNLIENIAEKMADDYNYNRRGIRLIRLENKLQLCTRTEYADYIRRALEMRKTSALSTAALEVLAIIAYRQPVTKSYIEQVRGVDSSNTVATLVEKGLIEDCGRLDVPGRPMLYRTTDNFLRSFGLSSVDELPELSEISPEAGDQLSMLFMSKEQKA